MAIIRRPSNNGQVHTLQFRKKRKKKRNDNYFFETTIPTITDNSATTNGTIGAPVGCIGTLVIIAGTSVPVSETLTGEVTDNYWSLYLDSRTLYSYIGLVVSWFLVMEAA